MVERGRSITESWAALASRPQAASLALLALCLAVYLPGFVRLPAVDRTEIIYAGINSGHGRARRLDRPALRRCRAAISADRNVLGTRREPLVGRRCAGPRHQGLSRPLVDRRDACGAGALLAWQRHRRRRGRADRVGSVRRGAVDGPRVSTCHCRRPVAASCDGRDAGAAPRLHER